MSETLNKTIDWNQLGLKEKILKAIYDDKDIESPTSFQIQAIPNILGGKNIIEQTSSDSSKILTFICGAIHLCNPDVKQPQVIILTNTLELNNQNVEVFIKINKYTQFTYGIAFPSIFNEQSLPPPPTNESQFIFGAPSLVVKQIRDKKWSANNVKLLILDEADFIIDSRFSDIVQLIGAKPGKGLLSENIQILLFSTTFRPKHINIFKKLNNDRREIIDNTLNLSNKDIQHNDVSIKRVNDESKDLKTSSYHNQKVYKIWRQLIQILFYRNDLIDTIKPFLQNLHNIYTNETDNINQEKHIPFLRLLSKYQLKLLYKYEIIDKEQYFSLVLNENPLEDISSDGKRVREIIEEDNLDEMKRLIRENGINEISPIIESFNEVEKMKIPIMILCIIQKAIKCFKYLLINGIEDPTLTMVKKKAPESSSQYEWDCMATAIYYGEVEIVKILEENGIEKEVSSKNFEAALLSYRKGVYKEIITKIKNNKKMKKQILLVGMIITAKNNNIKGVEMLINHGADINAKDII